MIQKLFNEIRQYLGMPHIVKHPDEDVFNLKPFQQEVILEVPKEEWAPGFWAGSEGAKLTITKVDLENRRITFGWKL